ncbi:MAG: molecular chaperone TorD family protein [Campylobacterota bacterium]|nr:molecular chaperone TorD family protein [Campylobacterota bacterium]
MDNEYRKHIYAFLSRTLSDIPDKRYIADLRANSDILEMIGEDTKAWFESNDVDTIYDVLNTDYSSMFVLNTQPIESFVLDAKNETLVGLQNPVMAFYFNHGFEVNMDQTAIMAPDHLSIEFAFMQTLIHTDETKAQFEFLDQHLMNWVIPYMLGMRSMSESPFYRDICDFITEFMSAEYELLNEEREENES